MNIAITGASGFIGQAVAKLLELEKDVVLTKLDREKHSLSDAESLKSFVENQNVVLHLAGVNRGTNPELLNANTVGMLTLLDALKTFSPSTCIVFASTFQVYLPQSLYGLSKKFAEELLQQYSLNRGIKSMILRLSNVYGPGGKPFYNSVIATFAHQIKQGENIIINGDGSQERDYIYVDDVADAFVKAALYKQNNPTETMDICSGESTSLNTIIKIIQSVCGKHVEVVYNEALKENPWPTKDKDFSKAQELLDWKPTTSLKDGLAKLMQ